MKFGQKLKRFACLSSLDVEKETNARLQNELNLKEATLSEVRKQQNINNEQHAVEILQLKKQMETLNESNKTLLSSSSSPTNNNNKIKALESQLESLSYHLNTKQTIIDQLKSEKTTFSPGYLVD